MLQYLWNLPNTPNQRTEEVSRIMRTMFSDPHRKHRLDIAIENLVREGYVILSRSDFRAELERKTGRLFFTRKEHILLEVDYFGQVHRA
jgi:hypothetical protein